MSTTPQPARAIGLFPTPVLHAPGLVPPAVVERLRSRFVATARIASARSARLAHSEIVDPLAVPEFAALVEAVKPRLVEFGELLFGERLDWSVKEIWANVLEAGGHQSLHNHANSFASGVVYLTPVTPAASLVFVRGMGAPAYVFRNAHPGSATNPFNADRYAMPPAGAGDLVLFPSWLLHEVPVNPGPQRVSLAFNALPGGLDADGYRVRFVP